MPVRVRSVSKVLTGGIDQITADAKAFAENPKFVISNFKDDGTAADTGAVLVGFEDTDGTSPDTLDENTALFDLKVGVPVGEDLLRRTCIQERNGEQFQLKQYYAKGPANNIIRILWTENI